MIGFPFKEALHGDADHRIGKDNLKNLPDLLKDPVAIIQAESNKNKPSIIVLIKLEQNNRKVVAPIYVDGNAHLNNIEFDVNSVKSVHGRGNARNMLEKALINYSLGHNTVFYINAKEASVLLKGARVTMPKILQQSNGFIASIRDSDSKVKPKLKNVTESQQFLRWFGDWIKHPERINPKLLNEDGTPKVFYHGTASDFDIFEMNEGAYGKGAYFTTSTAEAADYALAQLEAKGIEVPED